MIADAPPPPLQMAAAPSFALFCSNTFSNVINIRAPEHPNGCPRETAPPFTLTFLSFKPNIFIFASPTTENASLNSKKSISSNFKLAFASAFGNAFAGAVVNHSGS